MVDREQVLQSRGASVLSHDGDKIGKVQEIYLDRETDQPEWALVNTGLFGPSGSFVPLAEATIEGSDISVPYTKDDVKGAPNMAPDGELSQQEEAELYRHYGFDNLRSPRTVALLRVRRTRIHLITTVRRATMSAARRPTTP